MPRLKQLKDKVKENSHIAVALSSPMPPYRLCYFINKATGVHMKREKADFFHKQLNRIIIINIYSFYLPDQTSSIHLAENHQQNICLLPPLKKLDYLLYLQNPDNINPFWDKFLRKLKEVPHIHYTFAVRNSLLKSLNAIEL